MADDAIRATGRESQKGEGGKLAESHHWSLS
jgi:hypothetical protein